MLVDLNKSLSEGRLLKILQEQSARWQVFENSQYTWLLLNNTVQSVMNNEDHSSLTFPHQAPLATELNKLTDDASILELGLGGGTNTRFLKQRFTQADYLVVEKSPAVVEIFNQFFNPEKHHFSTIIQDAQTYVSDCPRKFDLIISDLYSHQTSAVNMLSADYCQSLAVLLKPNGFLYINLMPETLFDVELIKAILAGLSLRLVFAEKIIGYRNHVLIAQRVESDCIPLVA